jgi:hypothetical protein
MLLLSESRNDLASEDKKLLLESYGLDPHEFLSEPAPPKVFSLSLSLSLSLYIYIYIYIYIKFCLVSEKIEKRKRIRRYKNVVHFMLSRCL